MQSNVKFLPEPAELSQRIQAYTDWTETRWSVAKLADIKPSTASELVMALGLGGETGEVIEEILNVVDGDVDSNRQPLMKELGDSIYYWARLSATLGLDVGPTFINVKALENLPEWVSDAALGMVVSAAKVSEVAKKYVRDGVLNHDKIKLALADYAKSWQQTCILLGFPVLEVLETNQAKIEGRVLRKTVRGSGNDR